MFKHENLPAISQAMLTPEQGEAASNPENSARTLSSLFRIAYGGNASKLGASARSWSQSALLVVKIFASGMTESCVSRLPAGTTSTFDEANGSAEPQVEQKHRACRVCGSLNVLTCSFPDSHTSLAVDEKRLAACAEPVTLRQREQWQR